MTTHRTLNFSMASFLLGIFWGTPHLAALTLQRAGLIILILFLARVFSSSGYLYILAAFLAGLFYVQAWRTAHTTTFPEQGDFTGIISEVPDARQNKTFLTVQPEKGTGKLLVKVPPFPKYHYGDYLRVTGSVEAPEPFETFNYPLYLERAGIYGIMPQPQVRLEKPAHVSVLGSLYALRARVETEVQEQVVEPEASFLNGILLGSKRAIPEEVQNALKATGTSHIIAISGANITILLGLLLQFLPLYERRKQFWATVLIAGFVTILTGASASVLRGAVVACLGSFVRMHGRRAWATPLILFSLLILLFNNPLLLRADPGFQLSFAAYAGLLYLGTPLATWTERLTVLKKVPAILKSSFAETLAATLGTTPLSFVLFGQLSLLGLLVNPLVLWLLPATTFLGLGLVLLGWLPGLGWLISVPLWLLLHTILAIIQYFGQLNVGIIHWSP